MGKETGDSNTLRGIRMSLRRKDDPMAAPRPCLTLAKKPTRNTSKTPIITQLLLTCTPSFAAAGDPRLLA